MDTKEFILEPAFNFASSESSVLLNEAQAKIGINGVTYIGDNQVRLDLLPRASIHLYGKFHGVPATDILKLATGQRSVSSFFINDREVEGFFLNIGGDIDAEELIIKWYPKSEPINVIGCDVTQMTRVVFHLFNFVELIGTRRSSERGKTIEHVDLSFDKWKVELKSFPETRDSLKTLIAEGGYSLTHVGCVEKVDCTTFSGKESYEQLNALRAFFSFAKGVSCKPICAVGLDAFGERVWESWSSPTEPWHQPPCWFEPHHSSQLMTLFQGFMRRWENDEWREALDEAIYWYLNANQSSRGIDAGIILTQAAIERLSYEFSVKYKRLFTVNAFKALWASDKFRLLFSSLGIPLDIPADTPELRQLATNTEMNWIDAPHAVTEIRNSLVHPEHKRRSRLERAYYDGWKLGLWYLELAILAICGYSGTYANRLKQRWTGQVENVPWT